MRSFAEAVSFLTVVPLAGRRHGEHSSSTEAAGRGPMAGTLVYFPVVGLIIGVSLAGINALLTPVMPAPAVGALLMAAMIALTGGLHWDGLIDTCDAVFASKEKKDRLAILKDTHVGAFGLLGGVSAYLCYFAFLVSMEPSLRTPLLVVLPVAGRLMMVAAIAVFPYARSAGIGALFERRPPGTLLTAVTFSFALAVVALGYVGAGLVLVAVVAGLAAAWWVKRRLGGLTGDIYGALSVFCELTLLFGALIWQAR